MTDVSPLSMSGARPLAWDGAPTAARRRRRIAEDSGYSRFAYSLGHRIGRFIFWNCIDLRLIRPEIPQGEEPFVLALTHLGHIDPFCAGVLLDRPVRFMARREFYRYRILAWLLGLVGAFSVNRQGVPVSAIRRAIAIARSGQIVGICPEGGRKWGKESAFRGAPFKRGVCSVAIRAGVPIVPCVMLGTPELNKVLPWMPLLRLGKLWVAYGEPIAPPLVSTRATRDALRDELSAAYVRLYAEIRQCFGVEDADVP